jgi:mono/diheme cytochrome c family protein
MNLSASGLVRFALICVLVVWTASDAGSAQATAKRVAEGVFGEEQAMRGEVEYVKSCASCHGEDLSGSAWSPPLVGQVFVTRLRDQRLGDFFERIRTTMPYDDPATLGPRVYVDILAYLLKANEFPAGKEELSNDPAALNAIVMKP